MPKRKVQEKQGMVSVTRTMMGIAREKTTKIEVRPFVTDTANVSVKMGMTLSMGDYQSARIDVMISMPCYVEEVPQMYLNVRNAVDKLLAKEQERLMNAEEEAK